MFQGVMIMFPERKENDQKITNVNFTYDKYSGNQFYLAAYVSKLDTDKALVELTKRVGPMNHSGHKKEGDIYLDVKQIDKLLDIFSRYDLKAWSNLPRSSSSSDPSRFLVILSRDDILYDIRWNARFPKTTPPEEDIFFFELYNFFNDVISKETGWEEVVSENLPDPRDNPAYYEREVEWFGRKVRLVPGTGTFHKDGSYGQLDYEGKDWWIEEEFTGKWVLNEEHPTNGLNIPTSSSLTVREDGTLEFELNGESYPGKVSDTRIYKGSAGIILEKELFRRHCDVETVLDQSYEEIHVTCYPDPVPAKQFEPIDVYLLKQ